MKGFPRGWVTMLGFKELGWWCYRERSFTRLYLESHGYSTRTWQTDRRTDTGRRPRLCIVSRGKMKPCCDWEGKIQYKNRNLHLLNIWGAVTGHAEALALNVRHTENFAWRLGLSVGGLWPIWNRGGLIRKSHMLDIRHWRCWLALLQLFALFMFYWVPTTATQQWLATVKTQRGKANNRQTKNIYPEVHIP